MSFLNKSRKVDVLTLWGKLRLNIPPNPEIADLIKLIIGSVDYKQDFIKLWLKLFSLKEMENFKLNKQKQKESMHKINIFKIERKSNPIL